MPATPDRYRPSLGRVLEDLGVTLLDVVHGQAQRPEEISAVVIHDPVDEPPLPPHAVVLGVGLQTAQEVIGLLERLGRDQALALVVRAPVPAPASVRAAADQAGVCLLGLSRGVPWAHLAALLRSLLAEGDVGPVEPDSLGGLPAGDLFAVANAVAALMDAPITIEDRRSRVLAFSGRQNEADASRVETILGRHVPDDVVAVLSERGVFRELYRSDRPVYVDTVQFGDSVPVPRVAIAVRAGDEVLGSIWAATPHRLSEARAEAFGEAAKLVALHLLRVRAGADVQRRVRADLLSTALAGGAGAGEALDRLGLSGGSLMVFGVAMTNPAVSASVSAQEQQRLADAFAMHLGALHPGSAAALISGVVYGLVPSPPGSALEPGGRIARDFLDRVGERLRPVVAIGPVAHDVTGLVRARSGTDRILRVLRESPRGRRVAHLDDVQAEALLLELRDQVAARGEEPGGALARLIDYDRAHGSDLVGTLRAWLDAFGDVNAAAGAMYVHANTFRYRLRRAGEVGEIDLADAEQRFALMLQLRLHRL
ncbi:helix-turn-helix domain-containing protein [Kineosporia rhizophila]|uniref:PucR family transcriptional regulator n=1 Tax=Kineosporia rhizophila TaxID=84633 RepID=UPI001E49DBF4|nr:PucR family transcriptional regulator [Kineosporia rhizophila]MCE0538135.1 helix-turn-helix domain-containing protein [Kineosporia rhizophila]